MQTFFLITPGYLCIQGMLRKEKVSLIPNYRHGSETVVLVMIQIYLFRTENNVLLMLIDNKFVRNGC